MRHNTFLEYIDILFEMSLYQLKKAIGLDMKQNEKFDQWTIVLNFPSQSHSLL